MTSINILIITYKYINKIYCLLQIVAHTHDETYAIGIAMIRAITNKTNVTGIKYE